ncbi:unnamed protein product [Ilex paraguariensis]|uniref:sucrose-phosphate synthase n=1 Tax=Ilex paraguariensis TaxID=185542 RepID=A0ABC8RAF7_9AQUA
MRRIEAEELGLDAAEMVVTSTRQEIELYDGFDIKMERKLRIRRRREVSCLGRYMPRMAVIPASMDFSNVTAQDALEVDGGLKSLVSAGRTPYKRHLPPIWAEVACPKHHKQCDVPEIYRLATKTKVAAYGLPVVATKNGGPVDILKALNNGLLIDPHDQKATADALLKLATDKNTWLECCKNGLKNIHRLSWP